jgi:hypothetical protein
MIFRIMTLNTIVIRITTFRLMTHGIMTLTIIIFRIMTLRTMTFSIAALTIRSQCFNLISLYSRCVKIHKKYKYIFN